jgi:hypothetical protein
VVVRSWEKAKVSRIFEALPKENAFYFFTLVGNYTGESAASFEEFLEKIKKISIKSLQWYRSFKGEIETPDYISCIHGLLTNSFQPMEMLK